MLETVCPTQAAQFGTDSELTSYQTEDAARRDLSGNSWADFTLPSTIPTTHPWLLRYSSSAILNDTSGPAGSSSISTVDTEVYGPQTHPILFRIGNGGAGYTRILKVLCLKFIWTHGGDFRIGWVANHSRHSQIALLGDIVQVALTYEPEAEEVEVKEGWCRRVCKPAFWDHFVLVGPSANPADLKASCSSSDALRTIARTGSEFHSRGDGSATFSREQTLWKAAGVDPSGEGCNISTHVLAPYQALEKASEDGTYLLTDRATFLTAKQDGVIPNLSVYVEGEKELLNPCSALINTKVPDWSAQRMAVRFAEWLGEEVAQAYFRGYGRVWEQGMPLFTPAEREEFGDEDRLAGKTL